MGLLPVGGGVRVFDGGGLRAGGELYRAAPDGADGRRYLAQRAAGDRGGLRGFQVEPRLADVRGRALGGIGDNVADRPDPQEIPDQAGRGDRDHLHGVVFDRGDFDQAVCGPGSHRCRVRSVRPVGTGGGAGEPLGNDAPSGFGDADGDDCCGRSSFGGAFLQGAAGDLIRSCFGEFVGDQFALGPPRIDGGADLRGGGCFRGGWKHLGNRDADPAVCDGAASN